MRIFSLNISLVFILSFSLITSVIGQSANSNSWIDFDQEYVKIPIAKDGVYRISGEVLKNSGIPIESVPIGSYQLFRLGEEVPMYIPSGLTILGQADFIEFYGRKNRGELDRALFENPDQDQLNPEYSMFNDTSVYFLTWGSTANARFEAITNDISSPPPAESFYMHRIRLSYFEKAHKSDLGQGVQLSNFVAGEGFASLDRPNTNIQLENDAVVVSGPPSRLYTRMLEAVSNSFDYTISLDGVNLETGSLNPQELRDIDVVVTTSTLQNNARLRINRDDGLGRVAIPFIFLTYPRSPIFSGLAFLDMSVPQSASPKYFEFTDLEPGASAPIVYDLTNNLRMVSEFEGGTVKFLLTQSGEDRDFLLVNADSIIQINTALEPANFRDFSGDESTFVIITHPALRNSASGKDFIEEYKSYRSSAEGGAYTTQVYSIPELYDQFSYGVTKHPFAIKNFVNWIHENWSTSPHFLILGKAVEYHGSRIANGNWEEEFFIPTYGRPGADNLLFSEYQEDMPLFPLGRLAVVSGEEVGNYLEKVKEYDAVKNVGQTIEDKAWIKNVMHLGGGSDDNQQTLIKSYLDNMGDILIESEYGAKLETFTKTSTNPVGGPLSAALLEILEEGTGLVMFLGHSSASTLDFQINNPQDWNNRGKYPIFSAMGCSAGQIHSNFRSLSEVFVLEPQLGAIAFLSGSGNQYLNVLAAWGEDWYESLGRDNYGSTLGETLIQSYAFLNGSSLNSNRVMLQQQTLNGDPALKFHPQQGPDYLPGFNSVRFQPEVITAETNQFTLTFDVVNLGVNQSDSVRVLIEQQYPDGSKEEVWNRKVKADQFRSSVSAIIEHNKEKSTGLNRIFITLDPENAIEELPAPAAELNNSLANSQGAIGIDLFIHDNQVRATFPEEFSIQVDQPTLIATASNAFVQGQRYIIEVDTTQLFDSPALQSQTIDASGGTIVWDPPSALDAARVYYWRTSPDSTSPEQGYIWDNSSFLYDPQLNPGWNQSHYFQLAANTFDSLLLNPENRQYEFSDQFTEIWIRNLIEETSDNQPRYFVNSALQGEFFAFFRNLPGNVFVCVKSPYHGRFLLNPSPGDYGSTNESGSLIRVFPFVTTTQEGRAALMDFLEDIAYSGAYVMIYSYQRPNFPEYGVEDWANDSISLGRNIFNVIEEQYPGSRIRQLEDAGSLPFAIYYQKDVGPIKEAIASSPEETINLEYPFPSKNPFGDMTSVLIGPAKQWGSLHFKVEEDEDNENEITRVRVFQLDPQGNRTVYIDSAMSETVDLSNIDADLYPQLQLEFYSKDDPERTPGQLPYWRVYYTPRTDLLFAGEPQFQFEADTLFQGQTLRLTATVQAIHDPGVDSVDIRFTIVDPNNVSENEIRRFKLDANNTAQIEFSRKMDSQKGNHQLIVEIDPDNKSGEWNRANNLGILPFYLKTDDKNPLLDVQFDGRRILDGDLVSSKPLITVNLRDENRFLPLSDTAVATLYLQTPSSPGFAEISFADPRITFYPAKENDALEGNNYARIDFSPQFEEDGEYILRVQAEDASGNTSGSLDYRVHFKVITGRNISNIYNYPNPFSTSTKFVFTVTGDITPDYLKIQIMTVAGNVVREITHEELGPLRVGQNITEYAWDGRDTYGDRLAAGVYLYRVVARDSDGKEYDHYQTGGDEYFKKGYGKMVILR